MDGEKVEIRKIHWIHVDKATPFTILVRYTHDELETSKILNLRQKEKISQIVLENKYANAIAIKTAKVKDLQKLMQYIPRRCQTFYDKLLGVSPSDEIDDDGSQSNIDEYGSDISAYNSD